MARFSSPGWDHERRAVREVHWYARRLCQLALEAVCAILPNMEKLSLWRVRLVMDANRSALPGIRELELVHCWLRFSALDSLLVSLPNLIRLGIHGEHTVFLPTVPGLAESEPSLQHFAPTFSSLCLDLRAAVNGDHSGQWLLMVPNLMWLELGMTGEQGWWSRMDILDGSASTLQVLDLALSEHHHDQYIHPF